MKIKLFILALAMTTPAMAQTSFYSDRALQQVNVLTSPTPLTAAIPYGPVRVCSLPLTQQSPCLPLATITDINGNAISNSIGPLFGQLTTDATGRFTFGCTLGLNYQVQVTQAASNTPAVNYPITCPGVGANPQFGSLTLSGPGVTTFNAGITSAGPNTLNGGGALNGTFTGPTTLSGRTNLTGGIGTYTFGGPSPWFDITDPTYGAKCDGSTDDTTAINSALTAANAAGGGTVFMPPGKTCVAAGQIVMDLMTGVSLVGGNFLIGSFNGATPGKPILKLTGTTSPLIGARSSLSVRIFGLNIQYTSAAFTGEVIGTEHTGTGCGGGGCDTNQFVISDSSVTGASSTAAGAICGLCLDKTIDSASIRTTYGFLVNCIRGQTTTVSDYSINNHIEGNQFSASLAGGVGTISGTEVLNPGANWKIVNNDFEFGLASGAAVSTPTGIDFTNGNCVGCSIDTNFLGDMPAGWTGTVLKNIGSGISVTNNNALAGSSNLGTFATFINGSTGTSIMGNAIENYATAFNLTSAAVRDLNIQGNVYVNVTTWMVGASSLLGGITVDPSFHNGFSDILLGNAPNNRLLLITQSAPSIAAAGCGGAAAAIVRNNGTAFFTVNVGTTPTSACTITMPSASVGWSCTANDITTQSTAVFVQKQTGADNPTSITITNFNDVAVATAFVANDIVKVTCMAY